MTAQTQDRAQPEYWAEFPSSRNELIVEGLQGASCSPACKAITICAAGAWDRGWTAEQWRTDLLSRHHDEQDLRLIAVAEECMRSSGLWLWND